MSKAISARDEILAKLREGRAARQTLSFDEPQWESDVFPMPDDLLATFKTELETIAGIVAIADSDQGLLDALELFLAERNIASIYCLDTELNKTIGDQLKVDNSEAAFTDMEAAITRCECLIARTGSIIVSSAHESGRRLNVFPPIHVVWANASQLVPFVDDALKLVHERYSNELPSQITVVTGASRTADIEKTLVMGAHGPKELLVLVNSSK
jgi:L-lactate dehydrogenase complex protein LldG